MNYITEQNRIYTLDESGKVNSEITFSKTDKDTITIDHTFVDESLRGQGIASELVSRAVEEIQKQGCKAAATCSYAKKWLEKNAKI